MVTRHKYWFCSKRLFFGAVKLTKNYGYIYKYSSYGIGFDSHSEFLFTDGRYAKNVVAFGADTSSSEHVRKDIFIFVEGPKQRLDDATLIVEAKYLVKSNFALSLQYGRNSFSFVNAKIIYQLKANDSKIKKYALCLGNISKDLTCIKMKKKTGLNGYFHEFPVDYNVIDTSKIIDFVNI